MKQRVAIIIGAGPAGLTAAYELLKRTDVKPIVLERSEYMGGKCDKIHALFEPLRVGAAF